MSKVIVIFSLLFSWGALAAPSSSYFYGPVKYLAPDGKTLYGQTTSLVKRTVDPATQSIVEIVSQLDRNDPTKARDFVTHMKVKSANIFEVRDEDSTFIGQILFSGADWNWDQWQYDIRLKAGGKITGHGRLEATGIITRKEMTDSMDNLKVIIEEDLRSISEARYDSERKKIFGSEEVAEYTCTFAPLNSTGARPLFISNAIYSVMVTKDLLSTIYIQDIDNSDLRIAGLKYPQKEFHKFAPLKTNDPIFTLRVMGAKIYVSADMLALKTEGTLKMSIAILEKPGDTDVVNNFDCEHN